MAMVTRAETGNNQPLPRQDGACGDAGLERVGTRRRQSRCGSISNQVAENLLDHVPVAQVETWPSCAAGAYQPRLAPEEAAGVAQAASPRGYTAG